MIHLLLQPPDWLFKNNLMNNCSVYMIIVVWINVGYSAAQPAVFVITYRWYYPSRPQPQFYLHFSRLKRPLSTDGSNSLTGNFAEVLLNLLLSVSSCLTSWCWRMTPGCTLAKHIFDMFFSLCRVTEVRHFFSWCWYCRLSMIWGVAVVINDVHRFEAAILNECYLC